MSGLVFDDLRKRYGDVVALDGVSVSIEAGELFAVIGPSGCGKTTLLRSACGLELPDSGRVQAGGRDLSGLAPEKRGMGMVFQSYALFAHLTVQDNVAFGLRYAGVPRNRRAQVASEHLERVGLGHAARRLPSELSGGQQQRVALARALAISPRILLLDEPLSNLDARLRETTRMEIRRLLRATGVTALYVTHDQEEAMGLADRIAVMRDGRVEQIGAPEEIYTRPATSFVATFVSRASLLTCKVRGPAMPAPAASGDRCVPVECADISFVALAPEGVPISTGAEVLAAVRPESVLLAVGAGDGANALVIERAFLGASTSFRLRTTAGIELAGQASSAESVPSVGSGVRFRIAEGAAILVKG